MKYFAGIVCVTILFIVFEHAKCEETEEIRRRRQNGVFFGLTGLDRTIPFDLDAFFEQAAPIKTSPKVSEVSRPQRAFTTTTTTTTTTELPPPVRKPSIATDGSRLRLFDERHFQTQPTFHSETPFVGRGQAPPQRQHFQPPPETAARRRPVFFSPNDDQLRDNFQERVPPQSFKPVEHRPIAAFDFSGLDSIRSESPVQNDGFRVNTQAQRQQPTSFRQSFPPNGENDGLQVNRRRPFTSLNAATSAEIGRPFAVPSRATSAEINRSFSEPVRPTSVEIERPFAAPARPSSVEIERQFAAPARPSSVEIERPFVAPARPSSIEIERPFAAPARPSSVEIERPFAAPGVPTSAELGRPAFAGDDERRHRFNSQPEVGSQRKPEAQNVQEEPVNDHLPVNQDQANQFSSPFSTESVTDFENRRPSHLDFNPPFGGENTQPVSSNDGREVFDEGIKSENPETFEEPPLSAEVAFDDQLQSTEGDVGGDQFQSDVPFQEDNQEQPPKEDIQVQSEQPQQPEIQVQSARNTGRDTPVQKDEVNNFQTSSPDDHSNFPISFVRTPAPRVTRPLPQRFSAGDSTPSSAPTFNSRNFPSTIPAGDLNRDRSSTSRQQDFDSRAIRKPFQEANNFRDSPAFQPPSQTHFRTFNNRPQQDEPQDFIPVNVPSRPTRPTVRVENTGQISPSFVRVTEPTDFGGASLETEVAAEDEFTSNRLSASTIRPTPAPITRRWTTTKPLRRKSFTRRPTAPTEATSFESPSSASVARPSEATTTSFRFPQRGSSDRNRLSTSSRSRLFNNGASATENTIDDSFSPGFTVQTASRESSRRGGPPPAYGQIATACDHSACQLPHCFCGGNQLMPGNLRPEEIPQIVILTFDDAVNDLNAKLYNRLYSQNRKNPNGCPIKSTFYVSHEWTDYAKVQNLYAAGHEIASHSISHGDGRDYSKKKWYNEIYGQKEILSVYANVDLDDIKGMRSPFLAMGGDKQFSMLYETNFTYDTSMTVTDVHPPYWPYTLDYAIPHRCAIPPCPRQSYPGFWEIPMVALTDLNGGKCSMADSCSFATNEEGIYDMLMKNFERHYRSNRAPFGLYYHASWFLIPHRQEGFVKFLDEILKKDDVYLVSALQAIEWIKHPTPLTDIKRFAPWGCNDSPKGKTCDRPRSCELRFKGDVRYMSTCNACPSVYPWVGDTGVTKHKHTLLSN